MNQEQRLDGILAEGTVVNGTLTFDDTVRIDGVFKGKIRSDSTLVLGPSADVEAEIEVGELVVHGRFRGRVVTEGRTIIRASGVVEADLSTSRLSVESGARFNGSCDMPARGSAADRAAPAPGMSAGRARAGSGSAAGSASAASGDHGAADS